MIIGEVGDLKGSYLNEFGKETETTFATVTLQLEAGSDN